MTCLTDSRPLKILIPLNDGVEMLTVWSSSGSQTAVSLYPSCGLFKRYWINSSDSLVRPRNRMFWLSPEDFKKTLKICRHKGKSTAKIRMLRKRLVLGV